MDATQANNKDSPVASPEILSPGGKSRYGRTRKPKISRDYYNTEDVVFEADVVKKQSPKSTKRQPSIKSPVVGQEIHFEIKDEVTKIDDLGTKIANNFKANLQRGIDDSIKERKFFKSTPEIMTKAELPNEVDVTKVFKLISNNPIISLDSNEKKMTPKSTLKTYSNKRKHFQGSDSFVVESFGLPDEPIIPLHTPVRVQKRHDKIDVDLEINPALHLLPETWTFDSQTIPICDIDDEIIEIRDSSFTRNSNKVDQNLNITFSTDLKEKSAGEESIDKTTIEANNKSHLLESNLCEEQPQLMESNIKENKRNEEQKNKKRSSNYSLAQVKRVLRSNTESNVNAPAPEKRDLIPVNILKNIKKEISCNTIENEKEKKSNQKIVKQKLKNAHLKNSKILFNPLAKQGEKSNKNDVDSVIKEKRVLRSSTSNVDVTPIKNIPKSSTSDTETSISTKQEKHTSEMKQIKKKRHPWNKKKNEITESDLIQIKLESIELEIGDLAWAKIGNHPYWPCLITAEPQSGIHKKLAHKFLQLYHVRFFGDNGRRAWVKGKHIMPYYGRNDLENIAKNLKTENKIKSSYIINVTCLVRPSKLAKWQRGVNEAESLKSKSVQERLDYFFETFASKREKKRKLLEEAIVKRELLDENNQTDKVKSKKRERTSDDINELENKRKKRKMNSQIKVEIEDGQKKSKNHEVKKNTFEIAEEPIENSRNKFTSLQKLPKKVEDGQKKNKEVKRSTFEVAEEPIENSRKNLTGPQKLPIKVEEDQKKNKNHEVKRSTFEIKEESIENSHNKFTSPQKLPKKMEDGQKKNKEVKRSTFEVAEEPIENSRKNVTSPQKLPKKVEEDQKKNKNHEVKRNTFEIKEESIENSYKKFTSPQKLPKKMEDGQKKNKEMKRSTFEIAEEPIENSRKSSQKLPKKVEDGQQKNKNHVAKSTFEIAEEPLENPRKKLRSSQVKEEKHEEDEKKTEDVHCVEDNEENSVPKLKNKRHMIQSEYSNSDTDSKFSDNSSVPASLELQAALYRRNNIFRGVPKEKVCQICEKPGDVLKCRGPCNGVYHEKCALFVKAAIVELKRIEETTSEGNDGGVEIISLCTKKDKHLPRLSKSPLKGLSLAEKIDYRMKEIMKNAEYLTVYGESNDSSSEELVADLDPFSKKTNQKGTKKNIPIIKHVTADDINYICVVNEKERKEKVVETFKNTPKEIRCKWCSSGDIPLCHICNATESKIGSKIRQKCSLHQCGKFYHQECLKGWPQTQWSLINSAKDKKSDGSYDTFSCPRHACHTCISDDPRAASSRCTNSKVVKCLRCPATYHSSNYCVPAGTEIVSSSQIICPRHYNECKVGGKKRTMPQTINANWCFICSNGGDLICCETCPTSVHKECLPGDLNEDDTFFCEDCQSGRLPLYDEIVWVKLGAFRWWPALILFPNEVPDNVRNKGHNKGEFVVKFFGTYDHYWVGRGRTFLFQEGDKGHSNSTKKKVDSAFIKAIEEATAAHELKKQFKAIKSVEKNSCIRPPPYIRIKVNKPVGNVRMFDGNISNTTSCDCDPSQPHPCGPDSDCLNRLLLTECNPEVCPARERCNNQCFEKREYPPLVPYHTHQRGWGLKTLAPVRKGQFVIEYVGEIIDEQEYQRRVQKMHEQKEENYYFLTIDKDRTLDAGPKGNVARFMNHSCQPNCETQKWTVNGDTRVGLFATRDIPADTELTFNYNLECIGKEMKVCKCGAPNCSGFIGVKVKSEESLKRSKRGLSKKEKKKKLPETPSKVVCEPCFVCGKSGEVGACNNKICTKHFHLECVNVTSWPEGNKWTCPWHNCNICSKRTIRCCVKCINSFCPSHSEGNVRYDKLLGFVCREHDPVNQTEKTEVVCVANSSLTSTEENTEENAVTSTTPEVTLVNDEEIEPLVRLNGSWATSTPLKRKGDTTVEENSVSSVTSSDLSNLRSPNKKSKQKKNKIRNKTNKKRTEKVVQVKNTTANLYNSNEVKLSKFTPVRYLRTSRSNSNVIKSDPDKDLPIRKRTRLRCNNTL